MKLKLRQLLFLNAAGQPILLVALATVRKLPLPAHRAFDVLRLCRELEPQANDLLAARNAAIQKFGKQLPEGFGIAPGSPEMEKYAAEMEPLAEKEIDLPIQNKILLPRDAAISAQDLEVLEPLVELEPIPL